jgi:hypothetical protein
MITVICEAQCDVCGKKKRAENVICASSPSSQIGPPQIPWGWAGTPTMVFCSPECMRIYVVRGMEVSSVESAQVNQENMSTAASKGFMPDRDLQWAARSLRGPSYGMDVNQLSHMDRVRDVQEAPKTLCPHCGKEQR